MTDGADVHINTPSIIPTNDAEAGKANMFSKKPKRIVAWLSKAWTPYEKQSLPIFYKETIASKAINLRES